MHAILHVGMPTSRTEKGSEEEEHSFFNRLDGDTARAFQIFHLISANVEKYQADCSTLHILLPPLLDTFLPPLQLCHYSGNEGTGTVMRYMIIVLVKISSLVLLALAAFTCHRPSPPLSSSSAISFDNVFVGVVAYLAWAVARVRSNKCPIPFIH